MANVPWPMTPLPSFFSEPQQRLLTPETARRTLRLRSMIRTIMPVSVKSVRRSAASNTLAYRLTHGRSNRKLLLQSEPRFSGAAVLDDDNRLHALLFAFHASTNRPERRVLVRIGHRDPASDAILKPETIRDLRLPAGSNNAPLERRRCFFAESSRNACESYQRSRGCIGLGCFQAKPGGNDLQSKYVGAAEQCAERMFQNTLQVPKM